MTSRAVAWALATVGVLSLHAAAAVPAAALTAAASSLEVQLPAGAPLAGYGGFPRRAWIPDFLGRFPNTFWFNPSSGVHDPLRVRALAFERNSNTYGAPDIVIAARGAPGDIPLVGDWNAVRRERRAL